MRLSIAIPLVAAACSAHSPPPVGDAAPPDDTARQDEYFDPEVVQDIALVIAPADLDRLEASTQADDWIYVPATFTWKDVTLARVGVRYKGNSSRTPAGTYKRSFLFKFDEFVADQEFLGLTHVGLDNGIQFGSLFSERVLTDILRAEGVPVHRANHARLTINGVYEGVYVNLERVDKKFLARHFADNDGNLYKCDEGGPGARLEYLGDDPAAYTALEAKTNEDTADRGDVVTLVHTLATGTIGDVTAAVETDALLKTMAVMMFGGAFDQYTGFNAHNYYLYRDPTTSRWSYLVHDLDVGFADHAFGMVPVIDGWDAATPRPVSPLPLVDRMLDDPALLASYRAYARDYLDRYFAPALLGARLDALYAQIEPDLATDPYPDHRITNPTVVGYPAIIADLEAFVQRRYDAAAAQLAP